MPVFVQLRLPCGLHEGTHKVDKLPAHHVLYMRAIERISGFPQTLFVPPSGVAKR